jgi:alkylation response protein AidB-like acyl-CoA dehydrogenase
MILNQEQSMLRASVAQFFEEQSPVSLLRERQQRPVGESYDRELWSQMVDLGLTGITVPERFDGLEFGWMGLGAVSQEAGRRLVASPLLSSVALAQNVLLNCASKGQIERHLPKLLSGEITASVALDEGRFFSPSSVLVTEQNGQISGSKARVIDAPMSSLIFCVARREAGALGVALVAADDECLSITPTRLMDLHGCAAISFAGVPADRIEWLDGVDVARGLERAIDQATIVLAAEMMGGARETLERTVSYLNQREQFDVKLASFQALQHRCARLYCELELAESAVAAALRTLDDPESSVSAQASAAKTLANDVFSLITSEAVQLHGGMGVTEEMDIGLFLKRSRVCNQLLGSSSYHRDRYARLFEF